MEYEYLVKSSVYVCAGEPSAEHEEGRHPDSEAETQEHGRHAARAAAR